MKKLKNQTPIRFCAHCGLRYERATVINLYGKDFPVQFCSAYCAGKAQEVREFVFKSSTKRIIVNAETKADATEAASQQFGSEPFKMVIPTQP